MSQYSKLSNFQYCLCTSILVHWTILVRCYPRHVLGWHISFGMFLWVYCIYGNTSLLYLYLKNFTSTFLYCNIKFIGGWWHVAETAVANRYSHQFTHDYYSNMSTSCKKYKWQKLASILWRQRSNKLAAIEEKRSKTLPKVECYKVTHMWMFVLYCNKL